MKKFMCAAMIPVMTFMTLGAMAEPVADVPAAVETVAEPDAAVIETVAEADTAVDESWRERAVERSKLMCLLTYTTTGKQFPYPPVTDKRYGRPRAGSEVKGIPYSMSRHSGKLVGIDLTFRTYISALFDPNSVIYDQQKWQKAISSGGARAYYGQVCTSLVEYALNMEHYVATQELNGWEGFVKIDPEDIQPGDVVLSSAGRPKGNGKSRKTTAGHLTMITGVHRDAAGKVTEVEWCEGTVPVSIWRDYEPVEKFMERETGKIKAKDALFRLTYTPDIPDDDPDYYDCIDDDYRITDYSNIPFASCNYGDGAAVSTTETDVTINTVAFPGDTNESKFDIEVIAPDGSVTEYTSVAKGTVAGKIKELQPGLYTINATRLDDGKTSVSQFAAVELCVSYDERERTLMSKTITGSPEVSAPLWHINALNNEAHIEKQIVVEDAQPCVVDCTPFYKIGDGVMQSFLYTDPADEFRYVRAVYRVEVNGEFWGNVFRDYKLQHKARKISVLDIDPDKVFKVKVKPGTWNVRRGIGSSYDVITTVKGGDILEVIYEDNWYCILIDDEEAWISREAVETIEG